MLKGKNILLGVTGSIAAYKALELVRLFTKNGANVRVLMSEEAKRFVTPLSFEALSKNRVLSLETESWADDNNHIFINRWADVFVIAPATANTINKLSCGIADNLLTSAALAFTKPILIAPAANTAMFLHRSTQHSLEKLKSFGYKIVEPATKLLACDIEGQGALANTKAIFYETARALLSSPFWRDRDVVVTGGGTVEKIDDVRFISNFSSGKMAEGLATALFVSGANVTYIQSAKSHDINLPVTRVFVKSSDDMKKALDENIANIKKTPSPFLFMAAAVSDYKPLEQKNGKLKKEEIGKSFNLELVKNKDLLFNLDKTGIKTVGFKAEFDNKEAKECAKNMLKIKNLNAVCLNVIGEQNPFGSDENTITFITADSEKEFGKKTKLAISFEILKACEEL
ncbi:MAG: bifunctional phosphopantothenoylcysteine decarboxylase/phosphopantothenate--cysteine ligase CoaBC [Campylobacteraceae bacterium]|jgi:phosphopantothenoylcysteine decarboxylase/phosphopantothenate--cysteine ligase|nr:bifunctional phosphopantothenoylcysteine decarboxylase/phosphopantothenate--cysteine ligase CoaBC [Campylobacteraceae bacterium]